MENDIKDPCRYCTDKSVCRGQCAKASPYINTLRADLKKRIEANKKRPATAATVTRQ